MKAKNLGLLAVITLITGCATVPNETVILSESLGYDLQALHESHRNCMEVYYRNIKGSINSFIDEVYAPFIIHSTLNKELDNYRKGGNSFYKNIEIAGQKGGKKDSDDVLNSMYDFLAAAREQIEKKRNEYLFPVLKQENELIHSVDQAYERAIQANSKITASLLDIRNEKENRKSILPGTGISGADTLTTNNLVRLSESIDQVVEEGKKIDIRGDDAYRQVEAVSKRIKQLTTQY
jgi:hypothetical protein